MNSWRPPSISERSLELLVAFMIFFTGVYGFLDPTWPPMEAEIGSGYWIIIAEDAYLVAAGVILIVAILIQGFFRRTKTLHNRNEKQIAWWIAHAIAWEMFGWLFVATATAVISLTTFVFPPTALTEANSTTEILLAWMLLWGATAAASFAKFLHIRRFIRSRR